jgi:hypothetical protein
MTRLHIFAPLALLVLSAFVTSAGAQWAAGSGDAVCTADSNQYNAAACLDGTGGVIITWQDFRNGQADPTLPNSSDIYAQRLNAAGVPQWTTNGVAVCAHSYGQREPSIVSDGAGGAIIAWTDHRGGNVDIYAQRINTSGQSQWTADGVPVDVSFLIDFQARIVSDGAGGAIVVWNGYGAPQPLIYAQRIDASGATQWPPLTVMIATDAASVISDGAGGAIVTSARWFSPMRDIYAQRVNHGGVQLWTSFAPICDDPADQSEPVLASDGDGGAIIAWTDGRTTPSRIFAQHVSDAGTFEWTLNGISVGGPGGSANILADNAGGAIVAWEDVRAGTNDHNIFAQRVNGSGSILWSPGGNLLCSAPANQFNPHAVPDGAGGAIVTWKDFRTGSDFDIYAQRVNGDGHVKWTPNGVGLATASGDQYNDATLADGDLGVFVAFVNDSGGDQDRLTGNTDDIYAQRVNTDGGLPTAVRAPTSAPALTLSRNHPNPFSNRTALELALPRASTVSVDIFDVAGRRVRKIEMGDEKTGVMELIFDGRDGHEHDLPSGVYFFRVHAGGETVTRKIVIAH